MIVQAKRSRKAAGAINNPDEALEALRSQPDFSTLADVLHFLHETSSNSNGFNIRLPGPKSLQIINQLVGSILSDFWPLLKSYAPGRQGTVDPSQVDRRQQFVSCLSGINGLSAIETTLKRLLKTAGEAVGRARESRIVPIQDLLDVLSEVLDHDYLWTTWSGINESHVEEREKLMQWRELVGLLCMGKVLSVAAEAWNFIKDVYEERSVPWVAESTKFGQWLGKNITSMLMQLEDGESLGWKAVASMYEKSFLLPYPDETVEQIWQGLLLRSPPQWTRLRTLLRHITRPQQQKLLLSILRLLSKYATSWGDSGLSKLLVTNKPPPAVGGMAALLRGIIHEDDFLKGNLRERLLGAGMTSRGGIAVRTAATAALGAEEVQIQMLVNRSLQKLADPVQIQHTPTLMQEELVQVLLLSVGCMHRSNPRSLAAVARSSPYLNTISNRLAVSSSRLRLLGMIVGTAVSALVDEPSKRMNFGTDEMNGVDVDWYLSLTTVALEVGSLADLKEALAAPPSQGPQQQRKPPPIPKTPKPIATNQKPKTLIQTLADDGVDVNDGLVTYEKPDSDKEDEVDDPTLVNRAKLMPPVYVRDLLSGLRDENYERQQLALVTAATLIRRKAPFGTEIAEHADDLATILTGLHDKFEMENFDDLRLKAMIALLVAKPDMMGRWFARAFFDGDYSNSQRVSILTTLGLGAREISGIRDDTVVQTGAETNLRASFPSKRLPEKLHTLYTEDASPVEVVARRLERTMIQPMAVDAAENFAGPNALKVVKLSSRIAVEKNKKKPAPNELAKVVAHAFFYPLVGGGWQSKVTNKSFPHTLLSTYITTISIILHSSGPSVGSLTQMTSEYWDMLLSVRSHPSNETSILQSLLFAFLTILDINENKRRLAEEHARELIETQSWARLVFEKTAGGDIDSDRVRMLAASVLMKVNEIGEKYQTLLLGF